MEVPISTPTKKFSSYNDKENSKDDYEFSSNKHQNLSDIIQAVSSSKGVFQSNEVSLTRLKVKVLSDRLLSPRSSPRSSPRAKTPRSIDASRCGLIDTSTPIESVKEVVSKFGGIVDWKEYRKQTLERRGIVEEELKKLQEEMPEYIKQSQAAEESKMEVLEDLDNTTRLIEELNVYLERARIEERQAKQDSELTRLRFEELEQGITDDASIASKTQLELAKERQTTEVSQLQSVKMEIEALQKEYAYLVAEKDEAAKRAEEIVSVSNEVEKAVEGLSIELIAAEESLESAHAAELEVEEQRIEAEMAKEQDSLEWEKELKQAEDKLQKFLQEILASLDLKAKLDTASASLHDLKTELAAYRESKLRQENGNGGTKQQNRSHRDIQAAIVSAKKELEEMKVDIEKATTEVNGLEVVIESLQSELAREKATLATMRQRERKAEVVVNSIEAGINSTKSEIALIQIKEKNVREKMMELPKQLQQAVQTAEEAKLLVRSTHKELRKAQKESEQAKADACTVESRLLAAQKEINAGKASTRLASAAIKALQGSKSVQNTVDSPTSITLSLEEYHELRQRAHNAEELSDSQVKTALSQIELAKEAESSTLKKLAEVNREILARRQVLKEAVDRAETAKERKFAVEQELKRQIAKHELCYEAEESGRGGNRILRSNVEQENKSMEFNQADDDLSVDYAKRPKAYINANIGKPNFTGAKTVKKKKKSLLPRFLLVLAKKKHAFKTR